ncbi:hypothetical protein BOTCAL_0474g00080 [Botryotinia calthae]|uniref:Uncharacterized protein n=1 Tax=Botryotinia calthae TaxID=38488 RepID=A0A4Y8CNZ7_9HELO|nr:hypothetical protein BOTCAL_0474g00080 [Botryotinia calthae]
MKTKMDFILQLILFIAMFGSYLHAILLAVDWYSDEMIDLEMEMRAKVLQDLLHTPAEQRLTRVLDLCFFAVADSLLSRKSHSNEPIAKTEDFDTLELRLHLAERIMESERLHGKIAIGARSLVALTRMEEKKFVRAMRKLIEGWTLGISSDDEYHLPGVHFSTGFEKEIKHVKEWIEGQSKVKEEV